jgi:hypothetical protein
LDSAIFLISHWNSSTALGYVEYLDVGPDGLAYLFGHHSYRETPDRPARIAAEDGGEVYEFNTSGQHTRTLNALWS